MLRRLRTLLTHPVRTSRPRVVRRRPLAGERLEDRNAPAAWVHSESGVALGIGGTGADRGRAVYTDADGYMYVTGSFTGTVDFDAASGTQNLVSAGGTDVFVAKYFPEGLMAWARRWGGTGNDEGTGVAVDPAGNVVVTGSFEGTVDFNPGGTAVNLTSAGASDVFVTQLGYNGSHAWTRAWGGTGIDTAAGVAADGLGNVYTTGVFRASADFDPGAGTATLTSAGGADSFVSRLSATGDYVWARRFGAAGDDNAGGIGVDALSNVYTTGAFQATVDFDPGAGTVNLTSAGGFDAYVSKLDSSGLYVWARRQGGASNELPAGLAVDPAGTVTTAGRFLGTANFDPTGAAPSLTSAGGFDVFVSRLSAAGGFQWSGRAGGTLDDQATGVGVDPLGQAHVVGSFAGTADFDPGAGTANRTAAGGTDAFTLWLDAAGVFLGVAATGGTGTDETAGVAVSDNGEGATTGLFSGTADFDAGSGAATHTSAGSTDLFVARHQPRRVAGTFGFAAAIGGAGWDQGTGVDLDWDGNVYTVGYFSGTVDFDPGPGVNSVTSAGGFDVFVTKHDPVGRLVWVDRFGSTGDDYGRDIDWVSGSGDLVVTGEFTGTVDFNPGAGFTNLISLGGADVFVSRLTNDGATLLWAARHGGPTSDAATSVLVSGDVFVTGTFTGTADFGQPGSGDDLTSAGATDGFISRLNATSGVYVAAYRIGGSGNDAVSDISRSDGYIASGWFEGTADLDPLAAGTDNRTAVGGSDAFVLGMSGAFSYYIGAAQFGGPNSDRATGVDGAYGSDFYVVGDFAGTVDFDPSAGGVHNLTADGSSFVDATDAFVCRMQSLTSLGWARHFGNAGYEFVTGVAEYGDDVIVTGRFNGSVDFDPGPGTAWLYSTYYNDPGYYLCEFDAEGSFVQVRQTGGEGLARWSDRVAATGYHYEGYYSGTPDFDPGPGRAELTVGGVWYGGTGLLADAFVTSLLWTNPTTPPTRVYVDDGWATLTAGADVTDADPTLAGDQFGTYGDTAFATLADALRRVADGGTVVLSPGSYADPADLSKPVTLLVAAGTAVIGQPVTGTAGLVKDGPGTLVLNATNAFMDGVHVARGTLSATADAALGTAALAPMPGPSTMTVSVGVAGTLLFAESTLTSRTFDLLGVLSVSAGRTLTLYNATISGGTLRGPGTIASTTGVYNNLSNTRIAANAVVELGGYDTLTLVESGGRVTIPWSTTVTLDGFTNLAGGRLTVFGTARVSDFVTHGYVEVSKQATSPTNAGWLRNVGLTPITIAAGGSFNVAYTLPPAGSGTTVDGIGGTQAAREGRGRVDLGTGGLHLLGGGVVRNNGFIDSSADQNGEPPPLLLDQGSTFYYGPADASMAAGGLGEFIDVIGRGGRAWNVWSGP